MKRYTSILFALLMFPMVALSQHAITGTVTEADTDEPLAGANIVVVGTTTGASADVNGNYEIDDLENGTYTVRVTMVGFSAQRKEVTIDGSDVEVNFEMKVSSQSLQALEVFASRSDQKTPVAYAEVGQEQIENQLGSRDLPLVLNTTPSVYSTAQGGGSGDARINVRGFSQTNVAVMINGVPVNDMENGWVYWSNWDGIGDVAQSMQVQRGMSNVNLAVPSVGGTMNIITNPAENEAGGRFKQEIGNAGFRKSTVVLNSGLINDKFAFSAVGVRKTGEGMVDGTWTDAWAYYFGASYQVNEDNRLDLFALGAPQRHGQRLYAQNIATFSHDFARDLDSYDNAGLNQFQDRGYFFNQNVAPVSSSYNGKQYVGDGWIGNSIRDRYSANSINERENFFHKPQINLNWYSQLTESISLTNVLYYSGGQGGGTGTLGEVFNKDANGVSSSEQPFFFGPSPYQIDWDKTIAVNSSTARSWQNDFDSGTKDDYESIGILRNSRNNQWSVGDILKVNADLGDLQLGGGIDWRTAEIEHYREVRDLLGGQYYIDNANDFNPNRRTGLGDKVDYNFTNTVDWIGGYLQGELQKERYSIYATAGITNIKYTYDNHFTEDPENPGENLYRESPNIQGYQVKTGGLYSFTDALDGFVNFGIISKVPIFDNVIDDRSGAINEDPENEKYYFYEGGFRYSKQAYAISANYYLTDRKDRSFTRGVTQQDGTEGIINISGLDQRHSGIELETSFKPTNYLRLDVNGSYNFWEYQSDVQARYLADYSQDQYQELALSIDGLKVGNAPQRQLSYTLSVDPTNRFHFQIVGKSFFDHYADFDPFSRTYDPNDPSTADREQSWKAPNYTVLDAHMQYDLNNIFSGADVRLFLNIYNVLDNTYIQDATDNSQYNAYEANGVNHSADDAEVFFGLPRRFNAGVTVNF
ncbi:TonB-dependent receptor [Aliifodinibius salipaludis]|uniref:TonB-dependent receptor n=1 Tax=Fodinibius salipaludis TaxID=2032627 RepID=A0A2A2GC46_9BACT|nr:TonB-dependent receptor [Aliifodinibius salipaludis]PAU95131.1 TonB-dependent receptor [Aliifodinibius salipaludis]